MPVGAHNLSDTVEATVNSKGQVTLPKELRNRLGIQKGSRIRFRISGRFPVTVEPVLYDLEDLWKMADQGSNAVGATAGAPMTLVEMNAAKARGKW